jgi:hypothetical protein
MVKIGVPRGSPSLGHVAPYYLPRKKPRVKTSFVHGQPLSHCHVSTVATSAATDALLTSPPGATCHPSNGDTCHLPIGQNACQKCQKCVTRGTLWCRHVSCTDGHVGLYGCPVSSTASATSAVRPAQSAHFFYLFGDSNRSR